MTKQASQTRNEIAQKSKIGVILLSLRSLGLNVLKFISSLTLAKLLTPYDYGVYGVLNSWISSLSYFTDIGLHESFIQKEEPISKQEVQSYLALRLSLSVLAAIFFGVGIYFLKDFVDIQTTSPWLFILGILSLFEAVTTLPKVILQKELDFKKLTILELVSSVFLYVSQITFAFFGFGFWSFFIGVCFRYIILFIGGLFLNVYEWPSFSAFHNIKPILKTGKHFQANLLIMAGVGLLTPAILKGFLEVEVVGIYFWTFSLVSLPVTYINNFGNVLFSAISKTQKDFDNTSILINKSSRALILVVALIFGLGATLGPSLIQLIFGAKWVMAKKVIALCSLAVALTAIKELPIAILGALGKPNIRTRVEFFGLMLLITVGAASTYYFQLRGFLYFSCLNNLLVIIFLIFKIKEYFSRSTILSMVKIFLISLTCFSFTRFLKIETNLFYSLASFIFIFALGLITLEKDTVVDLLASIKRTKGQRA